METELSIELRPYAMESPLLDTALYVYAEVWPDRHRNEARENFTRYAGYRDFHGVVAYIDGEPAGVGYGARSYPGVWWHDQVMLALGEDHPALQDAWRLVELAVLPGYRRRGVGGAIHDGLLASVSCDRALLSTSVENRSAQTFYERRGWEVVHSAFPFPGEPVRYVILGQSITGPARSRS